MTSPEIPEFNLSTVPEQLSEEMVSEDEKAREDRDRRDQRIKK